EGSQTRRPPGPGLRHLPRWPTRAVLQLRIGPRQRLGGRRQAWTHPRIEGECVSYGCESVRVRALAGGTMTPPLLSGLVDTARRVVRRDAVLAVALTTVAVVPVALVLAWLLGGLPAWNEPGPWPLVLLVAAGIAATALAVIAARLWVRGIDEK